MKEYVPNKTGKALNNEFQTENSASVVSVMPVVAVDKKKRILCSREKFTPEDLEIEAGTTVEWVLESKSDANESSLYTPESWSQVIYLPDLELESNLIKEGEHFSQRFTLLGDLHYYSSYNKRMKGVIRVVRPKASAPSVALSKP